MKTKRIISRFFLALIVIISLYLHSCEREEWCAECMRYRCFYPDEIIDTKTFCSHSLERLEEERDDFLNSRILTCWECYEPYLSH